MSSTNYSSQPVVPQQPGFAIMGSPQLQIDPKSRQGVTSYTVTNMNSRPVQARFLPQAMGGADPSWLSLNGPAEVPLALAATVTVPITVTLPPTAPAGTYYLRLDVVAEDDTEATVAGPATSFSVPGGAPVTRTRSWLLWLLIGVLVLVLGAGAVAFFLLRGNPSATKPPGPNPTSTAPQPKWGSWEVIGGPYDHVPVISARGPDRLDVLVPNANNALDHLTFDGKNWSHAATIGGDFIDVPAAVSWGANRIDAFSMTSSTKLVHAVWQGTWSPFTQIGDNTADVTELAVTSWGPGRLDLFFVWNDRRLWHVWSTDGNSWQGPEAIGEHVFGTPAAVSRGPNLLDVFYQSTDNHFYRVSYKDSTWNGPTDQGFLAGSVQGDIAVTASGPSRMDMFAHTESNTLVHRSWDGTTWGDWETIATGLAWSPSAVSTGPNRLDVVGLDVNHRLVRLSYR